MLWPYASADQRAFALASNRQNPVVLLVEIFGLKLLIANIFFLNLESIFMSVAVLSHSLSGTGVVRNGVRIANLAQSMGID